MFIKVRKNNIPEVSRRLKNLDGLRMEYGIFSDSGIHPKAKMPFATLLAIHELREDAFKRPVLSISVKENSEHFASMINTSIEGYITKLGKGRNPSNMKLLSSVGRYAESKTKEIFGDVNKLKPNSLTTIVKKGHNSPLIELGDLKNSISFKIKKKGEK